MPWNLLRALFLCIFKAYVTDSFIHSPMLEINPHYLCGPKCVEKTIFTFYISW